jgi:hypothetical protein
MKTPILILSFIFCSICLLAQEPKKESNPLKDYVGTYQMDTFFKTATVTEVGGSLFAAIDDYGNNQLIKEPEADTFKSTSSYGTIFEFKRDANKKIIGVTLKLMGQEVSGKKE